MTNIDVRNYEEKMMEFSEKKDIEGLEKYIFDILKSKDGTDFARKYENMRIVLGEPMIASKLSLSSKIKGWAIKKGIHPFYYKIIIDGVAYQRTINM